MLFLWVSYDYGTIVYPKNPIQIIQAPQLKLALYHCYKWLLMMVVGKWGGFRCNIMIAWSFATGTFHPKTLNLRTGDICVCDLLPRLKGGAGGVEDDVLMPI